MKERRKLTNKFLILTFLSSMIVGIINPVSASITHAESAKVIAAPGFFTKQYIHDADTCKEIIKQAKKLKDEQKEKQDKDAKGISLSNSVEDSENAKSREVKVLTTTGSALSDAVISEDGKTGILGLGKAEDCEKNEFNIVGFIDRLIEPVNITQSSVIMSLVYKFQILAIGIGVLLISIFGLYYALGNSTTDPIKFLLRGFFTMFFVYFIPYIAQDILNINNMLVYWITMDGIDVIDMDVVGTGIVAALVSATSTTMMIFANVMYFSLGPALLLVGLFFFVMIAAFILANIFKLTFWWYARLLMIIFLVALGPIFMVMMILPQTANYGQNWIKYFIGEVFTQFSLVLGLWMMAHIVGNLWTLKAEVGMSFIGNILIVVGAYMLLNKIPNMSKQLIGSDIGGIGWNDAVNMGKSVSNFVENAGLAVAMSASKGWQKAKDGKAAQEWNDLRQEADGLEKKYKDQDGTDAFNAKYKAAELRRDANKLETAFNQDKAKRLARYEKAKNFVDNAKTGNVSLGSVRDIESDINKTLGEKEYINKDAMYENEKGLVNKMYADATRKEVEKDIDKDEAKIRDKHAKEIGRLNELKNSGNLDKKQYESSVAEANRVLNKELGIIDSRRNPEWIDSEIKNRRDQARQYAEKMASRMAGNNFKNDFEKRGAISKLADEIENKAMTDLFNQPPSDKLSKAEKSLDNKTQQYMKTFNKGVEEVALSLLDNGKVSSIEEGREKAQMLLSNQSKIDNLKNDNAKLLNRDKSKLNGEALINREKLDASINALQSEMSPYLQQDSKEEIGPIRNALNSAGKEMLKAGNDIQQYSNALNKGTQSVAQSLVENGKASNMGEATTIAKNLVTKQAELSKLMNDNPGIMNTDKHSLKGDNLNAREKIDAINSELSGYTHNDVKTDIAGVTTTLKDASGSVNSARSELTSAQSGYAKALPASLNNKGEIYTTISDRGEMAVQRSESMMSANAINSVGLGTVMSQIETGNEGKFIEQLQYAGVSESSANNIVTALGGDYGNNIKQAIHDSTKGANYSRTEVANSVGNAIAETTNALNANTNAETYNTQFASTTFDGKNNVQGSMNTNFVQNTLGNAAFENAISSIPNSTRIQNSMEGMDIRTFASMGKEEVESKMYDYGVNNHSQAAETVMEIAPEVFKASALLTDAPNLESGMISKSQFINGINHRLSPDVNPTFVQELGSAVYNQETSSIPNEVKLNNAVASHGAQHIVSELNSGNMSGVSEIFDNYGLSDREVVSVSEAAPSIQGGYDQFSGASMPSMSEFVSNVTQQVASTSDIPKSLDYGVVENVATQAWSEKAQSTPLETRVNNAIASQGGVKQVISEVTQGNSSTVVEVLEDYAVESAPEVVEIVTQLETVIQEEIVRVQNNPVTQDKFIHNVMNRMPDKNTKAANSFKEFLKMGYQEVMKDIKSQGNGPENHKEKQ